MMLRISARPGRGVAAGPPARKRISERGSFLLEALVGGAILAVVSISFFGAISMGFASVRLSQETVRADQILLENLETVRVYPWSSIIKPAFIPTNFTANFTPAGSGPNTASGAVYDVGIAVVPAPMTESYSDTLRQVTVTAAWTSAGVRRVRSMTTLVSQNGIQTYKD